MTDRPVAVVADVREPQRAVRGGGDRIWTAVGVQGVRELLDVLRAREWRAPIDSPDRAGRAEICEPQIPVATDRDPGG